MQAPKRSYTHPLLTERHWLPVEQRVSSYKLAMLTFKIRQHRRISRVQGTQRVATVGDCNHRVPFLDVPFRPSDALTSADDPLVV